MTLFSSHSWLLPVLVYPATPSTDIESECIHFLPLTFLVLSIALSMDMFRSSKAARTFSYSPRCWEKYSGEKPGRSGRWFCQVNRRNGAVGVLLRQHQDDTSVTWPCKGLDCWVLFLLRGKMSHGVSVSRGYSVVGMPGLRRDTTNLDFSKNMSSQLTAELICVHITGKKGKIQKLKC